MNCFVSYVPALCMCISRNAQQDDYSWLLATHCGISMFSDVCVYVSIVLHATALGKFDEALTCDCGCKGAISKIDSGDWHFFAYRYSCYYMTNLICCTMFSCECIHLMFKVVYFLIVKRYMCMHTHDLFLLLHTFIPAPPPTHTPTPTHPHTHTLSLSLSY